jgi:SAM-dependent methyltransferase
MSGIISSIKTLAKHVLPEPAVKTINAFRRHRVSRRYARLSIGDAFDRIYSDHAWGGVGAELRSGEGSEGEYAAEWLRMIRPVLRKYRPASLCDMGCGDFRVGKELAKYVPRYIGVDISGIVIAHNQESNSGEGIEFIRADVTREKLPTADVAIMRQILQHLSNEEVLEALNNVRAHYPITIITEHVCTGERCVPNIDITHGPGTRAPFGSGVFIDAAPFCMPAAHIGDIYYAPGQVLRTWELHSQNV